MYIKIKCINTDVSLIYPVNMLESSIWCERLTEKERHNKNCIFVCETDDYDIYVLGEKYYYCPKSE